MPISLFSKLPQCLSGAINVNKSFFHGSYLWSQLVVQTDLGIRASETMLPAALKCFFCVRGQHVRFEQMIRLFICVLMFLKGFCTALLPFVRWWMKRVGSCNGDWHCQQFFSQPLQPPAAECLETRDISYDVQAQTFCIANEWNGTGANSSIGPTGLHQLATHLLALSHQLGCIQPGYRAC